MLTGTMLVWKPLVTGSRQIAMCLGIFSLSKYPAVMPPATTRGRYPGVALPYAGIAEWSVKPDVVLNYRFFVFPGQMFLQGPSMYFATSTAHRKSRECRGSAYARSLGEKHIQGFK